MEMRVLLLLDGLPLSVEVQAALEEAGYQLETAYTAMTTIEEIRRRKPDLVIVDLTAPPPTGIETCQRMMEISDVPIVMVSRESDPGAELGALRVEADLYMAKRMDMHLLVARINPLLRLSQLGADLERQVVSVADITLDMARNDANLAGQWLGLTPTEFRLLAVLAARPNRVIPYGELLAEVWGPEYPHERVWLDYVKVYIWRLRLKIERDPDRPRYILNKRGVGYWLSDGSTEAAQGPASKAFGPGAEITGSNPACDQRNSPFCRRVNG